MQQSFFEKRNIRNTVTAILFLLPNTIGFLIFTSIPVAASLVISFFNWPVLGEIKFVGLRNFQRLLLEDSTFRQVLFNTIYYTFAYVVINIIVAMSLALWLTSKRAIFKGMFKAVFFIPVVTPIVATAMIWRWLYLPDYGLINQFLSIFKISSINWLASPQWAMPAVIIMSVWQGFGYNLIIFIAGIEGIPKTLLEASIIDGAGGWKRFWKIVLPMLSPSLFFATVMTIISSFQVFDQTFVLTGGGPYNATSTLVLYIYNNAFAFYKMGYASAIAWILFAIVFLTTLVQMKFQKEWVHYE
ncbi:MAG: sugar ABC transporter permease [Treponemataceae bacterium]